MTQAIRTHYKGATNARGSTIRATCDAGSVTIDYPHDATQDERHALAAAKLADKFGYPFLSVESLLTG